MTEIERIAAKYRKQNNLDFVQGVLGTSDGRVLVDEAISNQLVYVRLRQADGYKPPSRHYTRGNLPIAYAGLPVILQRDENDQLVVVDVYREGGIVAGFGDGIGNTSTAENIWTDAGKWPYLYCTAMTGGDGTQATSSATEVGVSEWNYIDYQGNYTLFPGGLIDLSGDIPAAGNWLVSLVYLNQSNELASSISTAQTEDLDPLDFTDRQEALDAASDLFVPIRFWLLRGGATSITNDDRLEDARIWINDRVGGGGNVRLLNGVTKTVGSGKDFATIQEAYDFFQGALVIDGEIVVDKGTYTEALALDGLLTLSPSQLVITGDTRLLAGLSYVNGVDTAYGTWAATTAYSGSDPRSIVRPTTQIGLMFMATTGGTSGGSEPTWPTAIGGTVVDGTVTWTAIGVPGNRANLTNGGSQNGGVQFTVSGGTLTVLVSGGNPSFVTDGWGTGDVVLVYDGTTFTEVTLTSAGGSTLVAAAWPAGITNFGASITLTPDRVITNAAIIATVESGGIELDGFYFKSSASLSGVSIPTEVRLDLTRCAIRSGASAVFLDTGTVFADGGAISFADGARGIDATAAKAFVDYSIAIGHSAQGYLANNSNIQALYTNTSNCVFGAFGGLNSEVNCTAGYAVNDTTVGFACDDVSHVECTGGNVAWNCGVGYRAFNVSFIEAISATARDCTTGYQASNHSFIRALSTSTTNQNNTTNYSPAVSTTLGNVNASIQWT